MAEVIENGTMQHVPTGKINAGLTTGIIGTSLAGLMALGAGAFGLCKKKDESGSASDNLTPADLYIERTQCQNYLNITKDFYQNKLDTQREFANLFFEEYKRDVQNSFDLYKYGRDSNDALSAKIDAVDKKVDIMAAIRPYQDALIDAKINNTALMANYNLDKRTCRMITGELVLPNTPTVTGFASYNTCNCGNNPVVTGGTAS